MSITDFIGGKKDSDIFVSFIVGKNWIQAGIWQIEENVGTLTALGITSPWQEENVPEDAKTESFVQAADDSLSSALGKLEEEPKITKVIFGLPKHWVAEGNVGQDGLVLLKNLCEKLELKPAGFVVINEAIVHTLKKKEEGSGSFLLIGLNEEEIDLTVVTSGHITHSTSIARSISLGDDITEGLSRAQESDHLPPYLILYDRNASQLTTAKTELLSWEWPPSFFLHTPRIETLASDIVLAAVCEAAAGEIAHVTEFAKTQEKEEEPEKEYEKAREVDVGMPEPPQKPSPARRLTIPTINLNPLGIFGKLGGKFRILAILVSFTLFGFVVLFWFVIRASITIYLSPQKIEETLILRVGPGGLASRTANLNLSGNKTRPTSGRKTVGDRAKGEITILNNTASTRAFTAGTILTSPNGLKFLLEREVSVASESGAPSYKPGEAKTQITAGDIGSEYNLSPGTIFSIANFATTSFSARNDTALTGGSSREVASVEKVDQEKLEEELIEELKKQALSQVESQLGSIELAIAEGTTVEVASRRFSEKVGDDADILELKLDVKVNVIVVRQEELKQKLTQVLSSKIPQGFILDSGYISVNFTPQDENTQEFRSQVTALVLPEIDKKSLSQEISGKTIAEGKKVLLNLPGFARTTIKLSPSFPGPLARIPFNSANIKIDVQPER